MGYWEVKDNLSQLADLASEQEETVISLCKSCLREIEERLNAEADPDSAAVTAAAAALAYYRLMIRLDGSSSGEEIASFKAGDVSITHGSPNAGKRAAAAREYYDSALAAIAPLCADNGFAVTKVEIKVKP